MDDSPSNSAEAIIDTEMDQVAEAPPEGAQFDSEADKWKSLSRTNEARWKAASAELEAATAKSTELEQAMTVMQQEHALKLAEIHLQHAAQQRGMELAPDAMSKLNMSAFLTGEGTADLDAIAEFVTSFGSVTKKPAYPQDVGIGPQSSGAPAQRGVSLDARARR
ncbi:hypothetical protein [Nonomuraea roseoviolacea]|uniref:DUF4355 domain-containing protein n=1 Tax=Nonomuraea roseoviolacea subsp. carminata TaxID=160689 RepID=A0ABT1K8Y7_9ACTN|nr:hypothetical protein [Nonomuraea roseoviolacea]MCP2350478.1 hypothetical protein [Nonomuraea roseoviolacea subsp. carminata]